ncbi:Pyridoxal-dependent decarboxylase conserved domain containing protein [Novymonas esmeraldas]|uniref:Pyridoxal-dependent decarboxylase conserved domain containing protein n=1 Tax=Novymonas esmeraldas TaxID=1808958 RepID=A0AAW0EXZ6_9TRYP
MVRASPETGLLYRRLGCEARRLASLLDGAAAALHRIAAESAVQSTGGTAAHHDTANAANGAASSSSAESAVLRLRWWLGDGAPHARPPLPATPTSQATAGASVSWLHAWLSCTAASSAVAGAGRPAVASPVLQPVQAHHALHGSVSMSSTSTAAVSNAEEAVTNTVAARVGLPRRFHWRAASAVLSPHQRRPTPPTRSGDVRLGEETRASPAQAALMLWPTAMRTTAGGIAPRPVSAFALKSTTAEVALTALPTLSTAGEVFARQPPKTSVAASLPGTTRGPDAGGGGVHYPTRLEAYTVLVQTARRQALTRHGGRHNAFAGSDAAAQHGDRLVLYCSDQCDALLVRAAQLLGIQHTRMLLTIAAERELPRPPSHPHHDATTVSAAAAAAAAAEGEEGGPCMVNNYAIDVRQLQSRVVEDVAAGLVPLMVVGTFGSELSGSVDPVPEMAQFCDRLGLWFHVDASHGGVAMLARTVADAEPRCASYAQRDALLAAFDAAAALADSVLVPTGLSTALPFSVLPSARCAGDSAATGAVALFFSDIRKPGWTLQTLGEARHNSINQRLTPAAAAVSGGSGVLRVSPLSHVEHWLLQQHAANSLVACEAATLSKRVAAHQSFTRAVLQAIRGDGRFDASIDSAVFGIVCLRWLTAADESTVQLAEEWGALLAEVHHTFTAETEDERAASPPPVHIYVGLVQLQRRVFVQVSFGPLLSASAVDGDATAVHCTTDAAVAHVYRTLSTAASRVRRAP